MLELVDVIEALIGKRPERAHLGISDAVVDSRMATPGCLFFAIPGEHVDGHEYVDQAFERGAHIAIIQREIPHPFPMLDFRPNKEFIEPFDWNKPLCIRVENSLQALQRIASFWRRKNEVKVIGITGSVGKSTTKELVAEVLSLRYPTIKNPGNLNNEIGLPLTMLSLDKNHKRAVLEMGLYVPGEIAFLCDISLPQIGVITNIGTVHAERAGSQLEIARGKAELVQALPPAPEGVAILNFDDHLVREMAHLTDARVFFYGLDSQADLWADNVEGLGLEGIRFRLHYHNEVMYLRIPLIGRHSVQTALRAAAVGLVDNLSWQEIVNGLRSEHTQLRLISVRSKCGALLLDDTYNASPESMLAALNLLDELDGRKIAVLGDMLELGQYERQGHEMVGVRAAEVVEELITIGDLGKMIAAAAVRAGLTQSNITEFSNTDQVIDYLEKHLDSGDVLLVKGSRGMRMDRIVTALEQDL